MREFLIWCMFSFVLFTNIDRKFESFIYNLHGLIFHSQFFVPNNFFFFFISSCSVTRNEWDEKITIRTNVFPIRLFFSPTISFIIGKFQKGDGVILYRPKLFSEDWRPNGLFSSKHFIFFLFLFYSPLCPSTPLRFRDTERTFSTVYSVWVARP